ncbi:MAG: PadR family transcriptional regulator [Acidimicrobiia bacterium]|nr:PadR family transcriptional regulator [Acidimicrobiia bacterium]
MRTRQPGLLLGEWAVLGVLAEQPAHGFAVARRLEPGGDVGRAWSLSRPLTYRAVETLEAQGLIEPVGEEPGIAGGRRRLLAPTGRGRQQLESWLRQPVAHLRDVRSELLLKLLLCGLAGASSQPLVEAQLQAFAPLARKLAGEARRSPTDPVVLWRCESSRSVVRFLERLARAGPTGRSPR